MQHPRTLLAIAQLHTMSPRTDSITDAEAFRALAEVFVSAPLAFTMAYSPADITQRFSDEKLLSHSSLFLVIRKMHGALAGGGASMPLSLSSLSAEHKKGFVRLGGTARDVIAQQF